MRLEYETRNDFNVLLALNFSFYFYEIVILYRVPCSSHIVLPIFSCVFPLLSANFSRSPKLSLFLLTLNNDK